MNHCPICNNPTPTLTVGQLCPTCSKAVRREIEKDERESRERERKLATGPAPGPYILDGLTIRTMTGTLAELINHGRSHLTPAQIIATGQLLAGSWELLEACRQAQAILVGWEDEPGPERAALLAVNSAIAKATGDR